MLYGEYGEWKELETHHPGVLYKSLVGSTRLSQLVQEDWAGPETAEHEEEHHRLRSHPVKSDYACSAATMKSL